MKKIKYIFVLIFALGLYGCQEDEPMLEAILVPSNVAISADISDNGSGLVIFTGFADNAITYKYVFSDGETISAPSGVITKRFTKTGLHTYTATLLAYGAGGISSSASIEVEVRSDFSDDEAVQMLSGGSSKTWYLAAVEAAHLGLGPARDGIDGDWWWPKWYAAEPFEKCNSADSDCLCDDELTFTLNGEELSYVLDNKGQTFFNVGHKDVVGGAEDVDFCYDFDTSGTSIVSLSPSDGVVPEIESRGTQISFTNNGFMGYYVGSSSYEIMFLSNTELYVRTYDAANGDLAWYHKFTTTPVSQQGNEEEGLDVTYTNLVWADEFDVDGAPNASNWGYDTGGDGWGNNESQYYTDRIDNAVVESGMLKIIAKTESFSGNDYTSARLKTQGLYDYTYGRIDVRAKLPADGGTWPAIWTLGSNFSTVGWPACGEIDIMEHRGNIPGVIGAALHTPSSSGATVNKEDFSVSSATSEFHIYSMNWSENQITFLVDDEVFYTYKPSNKNANNWPYNSSQFIILNVAMGGTLGGDIDAGFTEAAMEIDYVRVYQ